MRIFVFYVLSLGIILTSCRKEHGVDFGKSPYYFYSQDSSKILYDTNRGLSSIITKAVYKDVSTDVANFQVISKDFGKDSKRIYYTYIGLGNVDYATFYWDEENNLPKDKDHVYYPSTETETLKIIIDADPETYEEVKPQNPCSQWCRDKDHYFYNHVKTDADRATLSFESPYLPYDKKYVFSVIGEKVSKRAYKDSITVINANLLRDSQRFYFKADCDSMFHEIDYVDKTTFKYYDRSRHIFRIDNGIYILGMAIAAEHMDANSFQPIGEDYFKDNNHVYYTTQLIPAADPVSFEVLSPQYAKDKNNVYKNGFILKGYEPSDFVEDKWGRFPADSGYGTEPTKSRSRSRKDDD